MRGWQIDVPFGHGADPRAFFEEAEPKLYKKLLEELKE